MIRPIKTLWMSLAILGMSLSVYGQKSNPFPDSLNGFVLKVDPLALINNHFAAGLEVGLKKGRFLHVNLGIPGVGLSSYQIGSGGFLFKTGIKFPFRFSTPYSILYLMPEVASANYNLKRNWTYLQSAKPVSSTALLLGMGYRHVNPSSRFYYDAGMSFGYAWFNSNESSMNLNHVVVSGSGTSGIAWSAHASMGYFVPWGKHIKP